MTGFRWVTVAVAAVVFYACDSPLTPPPAPSAPAPSQETILAELRPIIAPMTSVLTQREVAGFAGAGILKDDAKAQMVAGLEAARARHGNSEAGRVALTQIGHELLDMVRVAREEGRWRVVLAGIEAYRALNPGWTEMDRLADRARQLIDRPRVTLKGFFVDVARDSDTYAFLEVTLPVTREVANVQARPGEEFHGLRFVDVVGNNKGALLEYLDMPGDTFKVYVP